MPRTRAEHAAKITHHVHLQPAHTATTVRLDDGRRLIIDGPFVAGEELVSGFVEVDVADLEEAVAMARTWPGCPIVELRPAAA
ncbi:YciI family protein [Pseudonocardia sp. DLS-67]